MCLKITSGVLLHIGNNWKEKGFAQECRVEREKEEEERREGGCGLHV